MLSNITGPDYVLIAFLYPMIICSGLALAFMRFFSRIYIARWPAFILCTGFALLTLDLEFRYSISRYFGIYALPHDDWYTLFTSAYANMFFAIPLCLGCLWAVLQMITDILVARGKRQNLMESTFQDMSQTILTSHAEQIQRLNEVQSSLPPITGLLSTLPQTPGEETENDQPH